MADWAKTGMTWAVAEGVIKGTGDGTTLSPNTTISRIEAAIVLGRYMQTQG